MITIVHGDDIVSSRNYLNDIRLEGNFVNFSAEDGSPSELLQLILGDQLFSPENTVIIENIFSKKAVSNLNLLENNLKKIKNRNFIFWEGRELPKTNLNLFPKADIKLFKTPQSLFNFLDGIRPKNPQNVARFHQALKASEAELLFFMIIRQFRLMISVFDSTQFIDEAKRLAPWQKNKISAQARSFGLENLKKTYKKLYEIETGLKLGGLSTSLTNTIDFLLLEI